MFVLLVIPIAGGALAGRLLRSSRVATAVVAALWVLTSVVMVAVRIIDMRTHPEAQLNVNMWIAVVVGGLLSYAAERAGRRLRFGKAATGRTAAV